MVKSNMSVYAVHLYKLYGAQWVFDDIANKIEAEAFVAGADKVLDAEIPEYDSSKIYILQFSKTDFPGSKHLERINKQYLRENLKNTTHEVTDSGSFWESSALPEDDNILWLCDTLDVYFGDDVDIIYYNVITTKPANGTN
jgi:hypothetical protein